MATGEPTGLEAIARGLGRRAGSYLAGTVRQRGETCIVCAAPVGSGFVRCKPCDEYVHRAGPLADRVGSMVYAIKPDSQTYLVVRNYKAERPGRDHLFVMSSLLALGLRRHSACASRLAGVDIDAWTVVSSTRGRTTLRKLVSALAKSPEQEIPARFTGQPGERDLAPEHWSVGLERDVRHVLVIDDSWVSGAHAQSVAASLKRAGVETVSIFTVARVLDPDWTPNKPLLRRLRDDPPDWRGCPWTGGHCPS